MRSEVGINPQSLSYGFLNEIMDHSYSDGGPRNNRIGCTKFCEGCIKSLKMRSEMRIAPKHFLIGSKMKLWTIHIQKGVLKAIGSDVPNLMNDVPNFVKDVPRIPKCVSRWGLTPNSFLMGF